MLLFVLVVARLARGSDAAEGFLGGGEIFSFGGFEEVGTASAELFGCGVGPNAVGAAAVFHQRVADLVEDCGVSGDGVPGFVVGRGAIEGFFEVGAMRLDDALHESAGFSWARFALFDLGDADGGSVDDGEEGEESGEMRDAESIHESFREGEISNDIREC